MTIPAKDLKLLWGKAAGRCSMRECRKTLHKASEGVASGDILIGENCHIVAESNGPKAPRGKSSLTPQERNRYPNLILLCRNHHTQIDTDPDAWPVEKLNQIKSDHEVWVETKLTCNSEDIASQLYSDFVNTITDSLLLDSWNAVSDCLVRMLLLKNFVDGGCLIEEKRHKTTWPGKYPELESAIKNLCDRSSQYIDHFMKNSELGNGDYYVEDLGWKREWRDDYHDYLQKSIQWEKESTDLLFNLVVALNEYADSVRKFLNPKYFLFEGKFCIYDSFGVLNSLSPAMFIPDEYINDPL